MHKLALQFNERNLIKMIDLPNQLSGAEKEKLAGLIRLEKQKYQETANHRFDSSKNWSIMIEKDCNEERNGIMRRLKFQQMRKHKLHEFARKERENLIKDRGHTAPSKVTEYDDITSLGRPSTAATTNVATN